MKRRLEVERAIAKEADVQTGEISKRFAEHHVVLQKYFDTDQRKAVGEWNSLIQAAEEQYEAQAKMYKDGENVDVKTQAISRSVKSVKSIMKVGNDVYHVPSIFIHGFASEKNMEAADTSFASGLTIVMKQNISWTKMILPESQGKGIECYNWPVGVPFESMKVMDANPIWSS
ncbi:hypothetical protein K501DRAFT_269069 [Backusella circina FSU 941]|nr:hypothetical protein K501DRAFT_269069 [Backusella circina FSU 941]